VKWVIFKADGIHLGFLDIQVSYLPTFESILNRRLWVVDHPEEKIR